MGMQTVLTLPIEREGSLPDRFLDDLRFPEALVREFLERYTDAGDAVLDPFAGFATVLRVAAELDRAAYGLEYDADKVEYGRRELESFHGSDSNSSPTPTVLRGDALEFSRYSADLPRFDCCLTSPPFATDGTTVDPLRDYAGESDYETYLEDLRDVFAQVNRRMRPGGRIVLEVSNLKTGEGVTTLAWDVADSLSEVLHFEGEVVVAWEGSDEDGYGGEGTYGYGYDHSYCLVFEATGS